MKENFRAKNRLTRPLIVALAAMAVFGAVYYLVSSEGRIPSLPRIELSENEQKKATEALLARLKGFELLAEEKELTALLTEIHRLETTLESEGSKLKETLSRFKKTASDMIEKDRQRYLLLGDYLAFEFGRTLDELLSVAQRDGFAAVRANNLKMIEEIEVKGGSFLKRARRRGMIGDRGKLNAPRITPQILFRIRWRHLGGLPIEVELSPEERKAYYDFTVAFTSPSSVKRRLVAIHRIKETDDSYNELIAQAIVLHESGNDQDAYQILKKAIDQGRSDAEILSFAKALR